MDEIKVIYVVVKIEDFTHISIVHFFLKEDDARNKVKELAKLAKEDKDMYPQFARNSNYSYYKIQINEVTLKYLKDTGQV